jgi:predicted KAP-like P-loop ATPase
MLNDRPIERAEDDRLGRAALAKAIALDIGRASGVVAAITGPWGSGKTSLLNMAQAQFDPETTVILEFNPWYFSGTEQLVQHFFTELAAQLATRKEQSLQQLADRMDAYRRVLEPVGEIPGVGKLAKAITGLTGFLGNAAAAQQRFGHTSLREERKALEAALSASQRRFVIVVDDIDRLLPEEVRDVVRLVRLVADFPQTNYLLAFDRKRVEIALGREDPELGRDYLGKIVQILYPLPRPSQDELTTLALEAIDQAIQGLETRELDHRYWVNVLNLVVKPLISTPRDAVRYANAVPSALRSIGTEVNLADILALEAVRVLLPDTFDQLPRLSGALTYTSSGYVGASDPLAARRAEFSPALEALSRDAGDRREAIGHLLRLVFPGSAAITSNTVHGPESLRAWRRDRRVGHPEVFSIYFSRALPRGAIASAIVDAVFAALVDEAQLSLLLNGLPDDHLELLLDRLEDYEEQYPSDPTIAIIAIQDLYNRLPARPKRLLFDLGPEMRLQRVLLRLLRRVEDPAQRDAIVRAAFDRLASLSGKLWLILVAGHRENVGNELITEGLEHELAGRLRDELKGATPENLASERDLFRLLAFLKDSNDPVDAKSARARLADDAVMVAVLRSSLSETLSQSGEDITVQREPALAWDWLESLLPPKALRRRIQGLELPHRFEGDERAAEALQTAKRYARGWRPETLGHIRDRVAKEEVQVQATTAAAGEQPAVPGPKLSPPRLRRRRNTSGSSKEPRSRAGLPSQRPRVDAESSEL